ncbi:aminotransferase class I/II-fold pyridoxal phosphate-dependent enzyme [bacterium]|nr:aminotransferase class I/II-fold pyridoxal phosphate-dependent enzyme [bacterium]
MPEKHVIEPALRTEHIKYAVRDIVVVADETRKTGKEMLYLNIGDPNQYDFTTPQPMINAAIKAMNENQCGYSPSSGVKPALESIERYAASKGIRNIRDIFITTGGSEAIELVLTSLVNRGDNVLLPSPGYPLYTAVMAKLEAEENPYFLDEENGWQPHLEDIKEKINDRTKAIVIINPNNPTGSNCSRETLQGLIEIAKERNIIILADEIYDQLLFDGNEHVSIASLDPDAPMVTFNGLAKNYISPGWRIGWGVVSGPEAVLRPFVEAVNKLLRARLCANHPLQYAIPAALDGDQGHLPEVLEKLHRRRDLTYQRMNEIPGISCVKPGGAFYAYPKLEIEGDDETWTKELIRATGVVIVPGMGFGQVPGTSHFRIVFLPPEDVLAKAYDQIGEFMVHWNG